MLESDEDVSFLEASTDTDTNRSPTPRYNLRPARDRTYEHRLDHLMDASNGTQSYEPPVQLLQHTTQQVITAYVLTQMSAAAGIKVFGQPAVDAIQKEFCQLHNKGVFSPQYAHSLYSQQKHGSLRTINLVKQKRCGTIKGRTCAAGSVQHSLYDKSATTSPTVANNALMYTLLVDATADVVGAYLNADMPDYTLMKLTGQTVDIMLEVDKVYKKFVTYENNKPVLYLQLKKALYG
jgi:hypothetical protein